MIDNDAIESAPIVSSVINVFEGFEDIWPVV